jgi:hypothetical protein
MAAVVDWLLHLHGNLIMGPSLAPSICDYKERSRDAWRERERSKRGPAGSRRRRKSSRRLA